MSFSTIMSGVLAFLAALPKILDLVTSIVNYFKAQQAAADKSRDESAVDAETDRAAQKGGRPDAS